MKAGHEVQLRTQVCLNASDMVHFISSQLNKDVVYCVRELAHGAAFRVWAAIVVGDGRPVCPTVVEVCLQHSPMSGLLRWHNRCR